MLLAGAGLHGGAGFVGAFIYGLEDEQTAEQGDEREESSVIHEIFPFQWRRHQLVGARQMVGVAFDS